jgi:predicted DNA-binding transcriptional regulator AlpA
MNRDELVALIQGELLDIRGVAELAEVSVHTIHTWLWRGERDFPKPVLERLVSDRVSTRLWLKRDVAEWLTSDGKRPKGRTPRDGEG